MARRMPISFGFLHHRDNQHRGDAEGHRQADEEADRGVGHHLRVDREEELRVGLDPAVGVDPVEARICCAMSAA